MISKAGQSLTEYSLIALAIAVVSITALMGMGKTLNISFQDMLGHKQAPVAAVTAPVQNPQLTSTAQAQIQAQQQAATGNQTTTGMQSAPNNSTVVTVGANGTTESYAQDILTKAQQALASGQITPAEFDIVSQLANKGHEIALIQGLLENAFQQSNGNSTVYANTPLPFNGQIYTPAQLNAVLTTSTNEFSTLRTKASVLNGVLYDQALLVSINDNGGNIINNGYSSEQQNQTAASFIQYQTEGVTGGSTDTNQQSAIICTAGQHLDASNHCVP
jgi:hypothetical protein